MNKRILIIQAHPDPDTKRLCRQLERAYADGARSASHELRRVDLAGLDFPLLHSQGEWEHGQLPAALAEAQRDIEWAQHLVFIFPLWLGDMPALLKAFLEQAFRPGFAFHGQDRNPFAVKALRGRTARIVVTMGMPALAYRFVFGAHSLKLLRRNILQFVGIKPVRSTVIGAVGSLDEGRVAGLAAQLAELGRRGA